MASNELTTDTPVMAFAQLQLAAPIARAVAEMGYESMTPIQAQAIPVVLTGKDVMGDRKSTRLNSSHVD